MSDELSSPKAHVWMPGGLSLCLQAEKDGYPKLTYKSHPCGACGLAADAVMGWYATLRYDYGEPLEPVAVAKGQLLATGWAAHSEALDVVHSYAVAKGSFGPEPLVPKEER